MSSSDLIFSLIKIGIYAFTFIICFFCSKSLLWDKIINPQYQREGWIMIVFINIAISYLVGNAIIQLLMLEVIFS